MIQNEYTPDEVSPPGESLADVLEEREMSVAELAQKLGSSEKSVGKIIHGRAPITPEIADKLEAILGIPARFWNLRQAQFQEAEARKQQVHK